MNKVVVFQTWGIGDMIMSTPMLGGLRKELPQAYITIVAGTESAAKVVEGSHFCDEVMIISPGSLGPKQLIKTFYGFRAQRFDAAIVCTRISPRIPQFLKIFSGIKVIAGDSFPPRKWGYSHWCPVDMNMHRVTSNLNLLRTILPKSQNDRIYFHIDTDSDEEADSLWLKLELNNKPVLGIHPGGTITQKNKRFPVEKFLKIINLFLNRFPEARILIFLGADDMELKLLFSGIDNRVIIIHNLSLRIVGRMISKTKVLLAGDTGLGHIAAAMNIPVVTLAGPTNIRSTKPLGDRNIVVKTQKYIQCMPCYSTKEYEHCQNPSCLNLIQEDEVIKVLSSLFI